MNSLVELGRTLKIGEEIYESIDKVSILNSDIRRLSPLDVSVSYIGFHLWVHTCQFIAFEISSRCACLCLLEQVMIRRSWILGLWFLIS